ncbi:Uncharacterized protein LSUE1_G002427 [Lachnellula suecica]|uniref:Calcineurin-like phosphoesterase domain-containing protein n=1 Tax=Lachnellula suecica TaxID=602035 RepID=A0A8T9CCV8_9HELO|nr:Uncharacterized protein LSUE1_G002427 [Lachnellula suecica]
MEKIRGLLRKSSQLPVQFLSDLHLEVGQQYASFEIPPSASYLVLAGDIGRLIDYDSYLKFLTRQTNAFEMVFLVLGNHEFYGLSFKAGLEQARKLESEASLEGKLILLNQTRFDIPGSSITILGCTLWSKTHPHARDIVQMKVKDFQKIEDWTVDNHNAAHESDITWLRSQVAAVQEENAALGKGKQERKILIITHHAPSVQETANLHQVGNAWSSAFATDLIKEGDWNGVKVWVFGHTHFTTQFKKCGVKIMSNQRGYVLPGWVENKKNDEGGKDGFDVKKVVHV